MSERPSHLQQERYHTERSPSDYVVQWFQGALLFGVLLISVGIFVGIILYVPYAGIVCIGLLFLGVLPYMFGDIWRYLWE